MSFPEWDTTLFIWVNQNLQNGFFDVFLPMVREKIFWIPLYVFLLAFIIFNAESKIIFRVILATAITVFIADGLSSKVIKPIVNRERPCHVEELKNKMTLRVGCSPGRSFTSSHATNHFAVGMLFFLIFAEVSKWRWLLLIWAGAISFAQVYVGVHYPIDVICGGLLGILIALVVYRLVLKPVIES